MHISLISVSEISLFQTLQIISGHNSYS